MGMREEGVYEDDCDGMTVEEIEEHYGVDMPDAPRRHTQTGAGHGHNDSDFEDEDDGDDDEGDDREPVAVEVRPTASPFESDLQEIVFAELLEEATEDNVAPEGYGVLPNEWEEDEYPSAELLQVGNKLSGETVIYLPVHIWLPRAQKWANALSLTSHVLHTLGRHDNEE